MITTVDSLYHLILALFAAINLLTLAIIIYCRELLRDVVDTVLDFPTCFRWAASFNQSYIQAIYDTNSQKQLTALSRVCYDACALTVGIDMEV